MMRSRNGPIFAKMKLSSKNDDDDEESSALFASRIDQGDEASSYGWIDRESDGVFQRLEGTC